MNVCRNCRYCQDRLLLNERCLANPSYFDPVEGKQYYKPCFVIREKLGDIDCPDFKPKTRFENLAPLIAPLLGIFILMALLIEATLSLFRR